MDDPPHRVPALEPEREVAVAVGVEVHPERGQVLDGVRRLVDEHPGRRFAHRPAAGDERVTQMALRGVAIGERGRQPALGPVARGAGERGGRDERDPGAEAGGAQRRVQAGGAGSDDRDVRVGVVHLRSYGTHVVARD